MGNAIFMAGSAFFMTAYVLMAEAFGILGDPDTSEISPITAPEDPDRGGILGGIDAITEVFSFGFDLMGRFFQLLVFQAPGQEAASLISVMVFIPLTFINGWIIFRGIRG